LPVADQTQGELVDELHEYLIAQTAAGRVCVLILDEAQALSIDLLEQIRLLLNLETSTEKLLRIVLVGQPQLRKLLLDPDLAQLNQRITLRWHLGPLTRRETVAYVQHRLAVASNGRATPIFTGAALRLLHAVSNGIPRLVNMIAHRALLTAYVSREPVVTRRVLARAYHEIQAVPLPGTLSAARKAGIAAAGLAIGAMVVALVGPQIDWLLTRTEPAAAPVGAPVAVEANAAAVPIPRVAVAVAPAPQRPARQALSLADFAKRLLDTQEQRSARTGIDALLAAWSSRLLAADEVALPERIDSVAWKRGLQELPLVANRSMLRLLDLPALIPLRVPGLATARYVALVGMDGSRVVLAVEGTTAIVEAELLDRYWTGDAHVLWRDFEELGPNLSLGVRGAGVLRLQELLRKVGKAGVAKTGVFDDATREAVREFQRTQRLAEDGVVGPFTRIALYAAAGAYERPTLVVGSTEERS
jgi:general secretion pathway protein A